MKTVTYKIKSLNNGALRPFVPILLFNPDTNQRFRTDALIDTGADACSFPKYLADITGHKLKGTDVDSSVTSGIGGIEIKTWKHTFLIGLLDPSGNSILKWTNKQLIDCFDHNNAPPLLGAKNFLKDFIIEIDYPKKEIKLTWE